MKVLFLDYDGVLNSEPFLKEAINDTSLDWTDQIDRKAVELLNQIVERTDARIVVSSSWRTHFHRDPKLLQTHLKKFGFQGQIIGATPRFATSTTWQRGLEICSWMTSHTDHSIEDFTSVDDNDLFDHTQFDCFEGFEGNSKLLAKIQRTFVRTDSSVGLTQENVDKLVTNLDPDDGLMWTRAAAEELIADLAPRLLQVGYHAVVGGSVARKGGSAHDLDLVVLPHDSTKQNHTGVASVLISLGWQRTHTSEDMIAHWRTKGSTDEKFVEVWLDTLNRRVDVIYVS